jgi:hypothetical protein
MFLAAYLQHTTGNIKDPNGFWYGDLRYSATFSFKIQDQINKSIDIIVSSSF